MSQWRCASPMRRMQISLQPSPLMSFSIHTQPLARFLILPPRLSPNTAWRLSARALLNRTEDFCLRNRARA